MFSLNSHQIIALLCVVMCMDICSQTKEGLQKGVVTKDLYREHYQPFEAYIFDKRTMINLRRTPWVGDALVEAGARATGYDDFAIQNIPSLYSLFDRSENDIKNILHYIESDE